MVVAVTVVLVMMRIMMMMMMDFEVRDWPIDIKQDRRKSCVYEYAAECVMHESLIKETKLSPPRTDF